MDRGEGIPFEQVLEEMHRRVEDAEAKAKAAKDAAG
jgi:hypothetical protein